MLTDRQNKILKLIVEKYIKNPIPVGYKDLGYYTKDNIAKIPYMRVIIKRKYREDGTLNTEENN